jgi:hypothetical protein
MHSRYIDLQLALPMQHQVRRNTNMGDKSSSSSREYAAGQTSADI